MIDYDLLRPYHERYAGLAMEPLHITLELRVGSSMAGYDLLNLDNLLARCVVDEATAWEGLPNADTDAYLLPVPLHCLWRDPRGLPLWAATPFVPFGTVVRDASYWHKRQQSGEWTGTKRGTFTITATKGRYMERRVPLPTTVASAWEATCIGNLEEIGRLLEPLTHVGKRRSNGFGAVRRWVIREVEVFSLVEDGKLSRPLPGLAVSLLDGMFPQGAPLPLGWTPPQWKPMLFAPGWPTGTRVAG